MEETVQAVSRILTDYVMVTALLAAALYFTVATRGVQFRMIREMFRQLVRSGRRPSGAHHGGNHPPVSSFQAFAISIASRVGTGNLAGVATAIALGGPGAVFWMWVIALLGSSSAFIESTLAQLYKIRGEGSFRGGPAYYIAKGIGSRGWAVTFAVLLILTFGFAFNTVQSNTIASAFDECFAVPRQLTGILLTVMTLAIVFGGIRSIARFSQLVVPVMAVAYVALALVIIVINIGGVPEILCLIVENAFGFHQAAGGTVGMALALGIKRGLFSNEAGEGSTPNAAATAAVYTDTLLICSATAFIILCSGLFIDGHDGIVLTQKAIDSQLGGGHRFGSVFVSIAILFFAFTSIIANYYYGETNLRFIRDNTLLVNAYRLAVGTMVYLGAVMSLDLVWGFADITMALMTLCNLAAITLLGRQAITLLHDYRSQLRRGLDPIYHSSTIPSIADRTECWP